MMWRRGPASSQLSCSHTQVTSHVTSGLGHSRVSTLAPALNLNAHNTLYAQNAQAARVIALAGRFAVLPEQPLHENCTVHLLHGKTDAVMPYRHAIEGAMRLRTLGADFTADVLPLVGHELHQELMALAVEKLQQHIPARLWLQPGETPD